MELRSNHLSLPRCFRGPITIRTRDDRVAFSPAFKERAPLISDVSGIQTYFVGDRPRRWGNCDSSNNAETVEELLDDISIDGRYTSVRINWVGEGEVHFMNLDPLKSFIGGAERFFTTGRIF